VGIVGFTHIEGSWVGTVLFVKGRTCYEINNVPYPLWTIVKMLWNVQTRYKLRRI